MHEKKNLSQLADEFLSGKGFYIVLFACVAVIGVSAWLLLFSQYSPLAPGDEGDYLDAMGDLGTAGPDNTNEAGLDAGILAPGPVKPDTGKTDTGKTDTGTADTGKADTGKSDAPKAETPKPDTPKTDAATEPEKPSPDKLTEKPNEPDRAAPDTPPDPAPAEEGPENDDGAAGTVEDMIFIWPVTGQTLMAHSPAALIYDSTMGDWRTHTGVDIAAPLGTRVLCCANGTVTAVDTDGRLGTTVTVDHGAGVVSTYANLAGTPTVVPGDAVTMGSVLGSVGATALYEAGEAPHLHFSLSVSGAPVDPADYLPQK